MWRNILSVGACALAFSGQALGSEIALEVRLGQTGQTQNGIYPDIQSALDHVASLGNQYSVATITVRAGRYLLSKPIKISMPSLAAGTMSLNLVGKANESIQISGAIASVSTGWQATTNPRIVEIASPVPACQFKSLYASDGNARQRSRHPNAPYYYAIEGKPDVSMGITPTKGFRFRQGISASWDFAKIEVVGLQMYRAPRLKVQALYPADPAGFKTVEFRTDAQASFDVADYSQQLYDQGYRYRFYVENVPDVDAVGEWYCDPTANSIKYFLLADEVYDAVGARIVKSNGGAVVSFSIPNGKFVGQPLMAVGQTGSNQRNVTIKGFTFLHTDWAAKSGANWDPLMGAYKGAQALSPPNEQEYFLSPALRLYCDNCVIQSNTFVNLGGSGIELHGSENLVALNRLSKVGGNGIIIGTRFERPGQGESRDNDVVENVLDGIGLLHNEGVGIISYLNGGNDISHNTIRNVAYSGISVGWDWASQYTTKANTISYNSVENAMLTMNDGAAIYAVGNQSGSSIVNNYVAGVHLNRQSIPESLYGLYLDRGSANFAIRNNFIASCHSGSIKAARITNVNFDNNYLIADTEQATPFISVFKDVVHPEWKGSGNVFGRNLFLLSAGGLPSPWIRDFDDSTAGSNENLFYDTANRAIQLSDMFGASWLASFEHQSVVAKPELNWGSGPASVVLQQTDATRSLGIATIDFSTVGPSRPVGAESNR